MVWKKGESGNPGGRPKVLAKLKERALKAVDEHVIDAWIDEVEGKERLVELSDGGHTTEVKRGKEWVRCSELLASYAMGKPKQMVELAGDEGGPLNMTVTFVRGDGSQG